MDNLVNYVKQGDIDSAIPLLNCRNVAQVMDQLETSDQWSNLLIVIDRIGDREDSFSEDSEGDDHNYNLSRKYSRHQNRILNIEDENKFKRWLIIAHALLGVDNYGFELLRDQYEDEDIESQANGTVEGLELKELMDL